MDKNQKNKTTWYTSEAWNKKMNDDEFEEFMKDKNHDMAIEEIPFSDSLLKDPQF